MTISSHVQTKGGIRFEEGLAALPGGKAKRFWKVDGAVVRRGFYIERMMDAIATEKPELGPHPSAKPGR